MSAALAPPTRKVPAHFDGRTFVPDEPVDLPVGRAVTVILPAVEAGSNGHGAERVDVETNGEHASTPSESGAAPPAGAASPTGVTSPTVDERPALPPERSFPVLPLTFVHPPGTREEQLEALAWIRANRVDRGRPIPNWALDREWIYAEDHEVAAEARRRERLGIPDDDPNHSARRDSTGAEQ